jgi:beta-glucanase (GH16 family)
MVTTGTTDYKNSPANFSFKYGYVEVKARIPKGQGIWPAIWLLPDDWTSKPEIDIMEVLGHEPGKVHMTYHFKKSDKDDANEGDTWETSDLSQDWHTFGVLWQPEAITWYIDGVQRWRYSDQKRISDKTMYLLINLAVGGEWPGSPDKATVFPADYLIDYVRIWSATDASSK